MNENLDWIVVRLTTGALKLVRAVVLPVGGPGRVLVPMQPDSEMGSVERVVNASSWRGTKRPARFRSGLPCIRCEGSRCEGPLPVAVLDCGGRTAVATIRETSPGAWEFRISPADGAPPVQETGHAATAEGAFDAVASLAASRGWKLDPRPSPTLDAAA